MPGGGLPGGGGGSGVLQPVTGPDLAQGHQKWITDFVASGSVRKDWPLYRNGNEKALWLNDTAGGFGVADDYFRYPYRRQRCDILRDELHGKA